MDSEMGYFFIEPQVLWIMYNFRTPDATHPLIGYIAG